MQLLLNTLLSLFLYNSNNCSLEAPERLAATIFLIITGDTTKFSLTCDILNVKSFFSNTTSVKYADVEIITMAI
uniref:Secreted protein n=1 Tax=Romanomermis culicivorax TaxID=13658 RepID=A0A915KQ06_ROMCU